MNLLLLFPAGLAALAALLLPLLIHLARRSEHRPTDFAALRWLRAIPRPRHRVRLDEWPLLLVRLLLLAAVALLLAEPAVRDHDDVRPRIALSPGVDVAAARQLSHAADAHWVWLAPGFPPVDADAYAETPKTLATPAGATQPVSSLLRELDASLPPDAALSVIVPSQWGPLDAQRLQLSHQVRWQVVPGQSPLAAPAAAAPLRLQAIADDSAAPALRYLRGVHAAWALPGSLPVGTPADAQPSRWQPGTVVAWLSRSAPPAPVMAWVAAGGQLVLDAQTPLPPNLAATLQPVQQATSGEPLLDAAATAGAAGCRFPHPPARRPAAAAHTAARAGADPATATRCRQPPEHRTVAAGAVADRPGAAAVRARTLAGHRAAPGHSRMSTPALQRAWQAARRRQAASVLLFGLPLAAVPAALAWRAGAQATAVALLGLLALGGVALLAARRLDQSWLIRRLDRDADLEDSSDLLFAPAARLGPLQTLQRQRLEQRLRSSPRDLRPAWPWRRAWPWSVLGVLACAALALWPHPAPQRTLPADRVAAARASSGAPTLRQAQLRSSPPAYTALPAARLPGLDAKVPAGTRLDWQLQVGPAPRSVALRLTDGSTIALARQGSGDIWQGHWVAERASLYRILIDGAPADRQLHRLDVLPDRPPQVRVLAPEQSLVLWSPAARTWTLRFEASDDYAVATSAELRLTLAQGSGENITFSTQRRTLTGSGPARQRSFAITLEPHALGMAAGDDLIAQLIVHDSRQPGPQEGRSASVILRWPPPEQTMAAGLEASVKQTLPAYFRSQRQIIIDAEALLKEKPRLDAATFLKRSDAIGVDQRLLRLRYGQFLGEESEGAPQGPPTADAPPTSDAPADELPTADAPGAPAASNTHAGHDHDDHAHDAHAAAPGAAALDDDHDHDHGGSDGRPERSRFGQAENVLAEFGHTHDHAEAATLLDPQTRALLRAALDQMWQSEGELRQGHPERALPYANKALGFIKQVQQAERIYLARVGAQLPPIDPSRRLSGDRAGLGDRAAGLDTRPDPDPSALQLWDALGEAAPVPDATLARYAQWLQTKQDSLHDPLGLAAAVETLRAEPDCARCRAQLRAQVWRTLLAPPAAPHRRAAPDPRGQRYLDALRQETPP